MREGERARARGEALEEAAGALADDVPCINPTLVCFRPNAVQDPETARCR